MGYSNKNKSEEKVVENTNDVVETKKRQKGGLSAVIDPLLFEGGRTVKEIAALVTEQVGHLSAGKSLANNVRVRMTVLQKRGFQLTKDAEGKVKLSK